MKNDKEILCCICGEKINMTKSHNASPVFPGQRCCEECNLRWILPVRMTIAFGIQVPKHYAETIPHSWKRMTRDGVIEYQHLMLKELMEREKNNETISNERKYN